MSETAPEPTGDGGGKLFGLKPIWWLAIAGGVVLLYLLYKNSSSNSTGSSSGGNGGTPNNGQSSTGSITFNPPATNVTVTAPNATSSTGPATSTSTSPVTTTTTTTPTPKTPAPNPQPKPQPPPKAKTTTTTYKTTYIVKKGDTLASIAKKYGISVATLAHANVYVPGEVAGNKKVGQTLGTGAGLKTGQKLNIP